MCIYVLSQPPEDQVAAIQKKMELQYQGILIIRYSYTMLCTQLLYKRNVNG
jgi:hypothetical protein